MVACGNYHFLSVSHLVCLPIYYSSVGNELPADLLLLCGERDGRKMLRLTIKKTKFGKSDMIYHYFFSSKTL